VKDEEGACRIECNERLTQGDHESKGDREPADVGLCRRRVMVREEEKDRRRKTKASFNFERSSVGLGSLGEAASKLKGLAAVWYGEDGQEGSGLRRPCRRRCFFPVSVSRL
jgi:hypothetical protein